MNPDIARLIARLVDGDTLTVEELERLKSWRLHHLTDIVTEVLA